MGTWNWMASSCTKNNYSPLLWKPLQNPPIYLPNIPTHHTLFMCVLMKNKDFCRHFASWWDQEDVLKNYACSQERARGRQSKSPLFSTSPSRNPPLSTHRLRNGSSEHTWAEDSSILFVLAVVLAPCPRGTCPEIRFSPSAVHIIQPDLSWAFAIISRGKCLDGMSTSQLFANNISIW